MEKARNEDYKNYYEICQRIGQGAFGCVYKAKRKNSDELFAIKIINLDNYDDINEEDINKIITNELNSMIICSKENIYSVKFFEYFSYLKEFAIVMELCDNNLSRVLRDRPNGFEPEEIKRIMNQLNETFKIMVREKIVHRDIKLENILVKFKDEQNFTVKLSDYGISKQIESKTNLQTNVGTKFTMAPEILEGLKYNNKCDLWSIGVIIYQLAFKEYPYSGQTEIVLVKNIKQFEQKKLKNSQDINLDDLIRKLLVYHPNERINWDDYFKHAFFNKEIKSILFKEIKSISFKETKEGINCKVILVGSCDVGKTEIIQRFKRDKFNTLEVVDLHSNIIKKVYFPEEKQFILFEIWDTAGEEIYRGISRLFYKGANACIFVYDITNRKSFEDLKSYWIKEVIESCTSNISKNTLYLK